ncbi:MAG: hypothetical protein N2Z75_04465 [Meiothermus sp.]|uniref:hypothetical protein n=1 Tax=Meiothermus sp. TaxID=1955249 RepID=UPI0025F42DFF|nr:hypothetical protein [Meiothermus sp.]MCS7069068.1 hypothetical protein [Meiothermus sp.]MCX7601179.1 hypothetical protein [Meiothermus sp.]MDW8426372.1 hypothetical protein [Meiothermus sp.]
MNDPSKEEEPVPRRLIGEIPYGLLLSAPRVVAEGIRARLEERRIPVYLETPFTGLGLPEAYLGTYTGDVSLWVPEALCTEAMLIIERDHQGEPS